MTFVKFNFFFFIIRFIDNATNAIIYLVNITLIHFTICFFSKNKQKNYRTDFQNLIPYPIKLERPTNVSFSPGRGSLMALELINSLSSANPNLKSIP